MQPRQLQIRSSRQRGLVRMYYLLHCTANWHGQWGERMQYTTMQMDAAEQAAWSYRKYSVELSSVWSYIHRLDLQFRMSFDKGADAILNGLGLSTTVDASSDTCSKLIIYWTTWEASKRILANKILSLWYWYDQNAFQLAEREKRPFIAPLTTES